MGCGIKKRVPNEFLCAFKVGHRRGISEYIDEDFSLELLKKAESGNKEAIEALAWIAKYNNEYYKGFLKKDDESAIHNTEKLYREATRSHNARRRDVLCEIRSGGAKSRTELLLIDEDAKFFEAELNRQLDKNQEEILVELISSKRAVGLI